VADQGLLATSAFLDWKPVKTPGFSAEARETLTMASFAAARGKKDALADAIQAAYGVRLPAGSGRIEGNGIAFVWAGPDQWLAIAERKDGRDLEVELKKTLGPIASVVDQSDGRVVVRIAGPDARAVLAKGIPVDLDARAFKPGDVAITHASHIGVILWQLDDRPTYEVALFRSYVDSFAHWLLDSAEEYVVS
jgi:heterotetrameric sarcosine oxidase gamma subunit